MILSRYEDRLLVVHQPEHGVQTGLFAAAWGNDEVLPLPDPGLATTLAATHHDDGWAVWESRPTLDPHTAQPYQFIAIPKDEHIAAYRAGIARAAEHDPWTGLLVSMHGAGLYNDRYGSYRLEELGDQTLSADERALVDEFLRDMAALQDDLAHRSFGHHAPPAAADLPSVRQAYFLLQVWDRLSLQFAFRHAVDGRIAPLPMPDGSLQALECRNTGPFRLRLDPYPFVNDEVDFPVQAQLVDDRRYTDPEDFLAALAAAPRWALECRVTR
ncbi:hypothetical protein acdb102_10190 [Acidothermaceae bacterium B102]|nr:hypothetical protein acdb102_10190 [Acidothermaceae bacterium B102]